MMRVGLFIPRTPPEVGGGFTFEDEIFRALLRNAGESAHRFVLYVPKGSSVHSSQPNVEIVPVGWIPLHKLLSSGKRLINRFFAEVLELPAPFRYEAWIDRWIERHGTDIFWNLNSFGLTMMVPYITVVWDLQVRLQPWFPELNVDGRWSRWNRRFERVLQRATWVIAGTEVGRMEIEFFYRVPRERIAVLPHPTPSFARSPVGAGPASVLSKFRLPRPFLFYPAQFWPHKNHATVLLALKILRTNYGADLDIVFSGSDQGNEAFVRKTTRELGLEDHVHFLGFVSREELIALYQQATALVYASLFGPENLPPLEAFALGCPVVAAAVSGSEEQLGDAALLVNGIDPEAIARAVKSLLDDPALRARLIRAGHERAERFDGDDFVRGVFELLDRFEPVRRNWRNRDDQRPVYSVRKLLGG